MGPGMATNLQVALPGLAQEMRKLLSDSGQPELAAQVDHLAIVDRCRCGDLFCATFYTAPPPRGGWGPGHENVFLDAADGDIILDVLHGKIVCVEVLHRDELRERLLTVCP
jgi:hypothetical protein